jgi:hypothetical protein
VKNSIMHSESRIAIPSLLYGNRPQLLASSLIVVLAVACGAKPSGAGDDDNGSARDAGTGGVSASGGSSGGATPLGSGGNSGTDPAGTGGTTANCAAGYAACGSRCVDLGFDSNNCGSCGHHCASGQSCREQVCEGVGTGGSGATGGTGGSGATGGTGGSSGGKGGSSAASGGTGGSHTTGAHVVSCSTSDPLYRCKCTAKDTNTGATTYSGDACDNTGASSELPEICCKESGYPASGSCGCQYVTPEWFCYNSNPGACTCDYSSDDLVQQSRSIAVSRCDNTPGSDGKPWTCQSDGTRCVCMEGTVALANGVAVESCTTPPSNSKTPFSGCPTGTTATISCYSLPTQPTCPNPPPCDYNSCSGTDCAGDFCCESYCGACGCESTCDD